MSPVADSSILFRQSDPDPSRPVTRSNNRLGVLLDEAAHLFASKGFRETTMRDIATRAEMLPGSIYYHFPSKDDLLVAVYEEGVRRLAARIEVADPGPGADPWARLEAVMTAHLETILDGTAYARVIIRVLPDAAPKVAARLIELRDAYERLVGDVVAALPLAPGVDAKLFRLFLIGAANHAQLWRRDGPRTPAEIAVELVRLFRLPAASDSPEEGIG
jgi:AcrR family transcriptional regulator